MRDEWPNDHREWFPITPERLARMPSEYVLFSTSAEPPPTARPTSANSA